MTRDEYFVLLKERWEQTDKSSREAIHEYNEWKRELRHQIDEVTQHEHQRETSPHG